MMNTLVESFCASPLRSRFVTALVALANRCQLVVGFLFAPAVVTSPPVTQSTNSSSTRTVANTFWRRSAASKEVFSSLQQKDNSQLPASAEASEVSPRLGLGELAADANNSLEADLLVPGDLPPSLESAREKTPEMEVKSSSLSISLLLLDSLSTEKLCECTGLPARAHVLPRLTLTSHTGRQSFRPRCKPMQTDATVIKPLIQVVLLVSITIFKFTEEYTFIL
jgi:hypothetical protein